VDLYGYVPDEAQKARVGRIALDTYGVVRVNNRLDVVDWSPRTQAWRIDADSRRAGRLRAQEQSDEHVVSALRFALSFSRVIDTCGIRVTAVNGVVILRGEVPDQAGFDEAVLLARDTLGVRSVDALGLARGD
jgi:osmotically-inducible protein OsmY